MREQLSSLLVLYTPKFSASGVQCVTGRERLGAQPPPQEPVLSSGAQVFQQAMSSVCPAFAPTLPQRMVEEVREDPIHKASWVSGRNF